MRLNNASKGPAGNALQTLRHPPPQSPGLTPVNTTPASEIPSDDGALNPPELHLTTELVQDAATNHSLTVDNSGSSFHEPQGGLPSPYLQNLCPLCFSRTDDKLKEVLKGTPNVNLYVIAGLAVIKLYC